jgi:tripartite-type tricarboxylate transporter receptor subunit TctC
MNSRSSRPSRFPFSSVLAILVATIAVLAAGPTRAQSAFPNRPIRILTQFPPGAVSDISL